MVDRTLDTGLKKFMRSETQVVLVNMPFGNLLTPSIGLGLLKAGLTAAGIPAKVFNFQFKFAELIGHQEYKEIYAKTHTEQLAGEFIFASSLFSSPWAQKVDEYVHEVLGSNGKGTTNVPSYSDTQLQSFKNIIISAREKMDGFLEHCLEEVINVSPKVVGFTSLFHQHIASLCLAKRIKTDRPDVFTVFGGANCEASMGAETMRQFDFVDAVVSGEGDLVFPALVSRVLNGEPLTTQQGVFSRRRPALTVLSQQPRNTQMIENLDSLPFPDYDDYFAQLDRSSLSFTRSPSLLFETSRGCWWGEKHHCTFCGLNGETMAFRSKSGGRAFNEFKFLTNRYPECSVNVVDNILDMNYFKDFIPMLADLKAGVNLFYEVKANLRKEQLKLLLEAGICEIQPGIESFSDDVLRIMRKGVGALQNIQLLKWCKELGLKVYYNLIWGFPGEAAEDYAAMTDLIPLISHLQPPVGEGPLRIDRFSPNFEQAELFGFHNLLPHPAYSYVYPFDIDVLSNLAYFFIAKNGGTDNVMEYTKPLADEVQRWRSDHHKSELFFIEKGDRLLIWDFRPVAVEELTVLSGHDKFSYMACDQAKTALQVETLSRTLSDREPIPEAEIRNALDSLTERGLMIRQRDSYLALAYAKSGDHQVTHHLR